MTIDCSTHINYHETFLKKTLLHRHAPLQTHTNLHTHRTDLLTMQQFLYYTMLTLMLGCCGNETEQFAGTV